MRALLPLLALLLALPVRADWRDISAKDFTMAPPPAPGSEEYKAEMEKLLEYQKTRTKEQCDLATAEKIPDFGTLFGSSGVLADAEVKRVAGFVTEASSKASAISGSFKKKFARPRPYDEDARIQPCADKPGGATSYPSTHALAGTVDACILGRMFPDRAGKLTALGFQAGELRLISGVHHPSDVEAGRKLGGEICSRLLGDAGFVQELEAAAKAPAPSAP